MQDHHHLQEEEEEALRGPGSRDPALGHRGLAVGHRALDSPDRRPRVQPHLARRHREGVRALARAEEAWRRCKLRYACKRALCSHRHRVRLRRRQRVAVQAVQPDRVGHGLLVLGQRSRHGGLRCHRHRVEGRGAHGLVCLRLLIMSTQCAAATRGQVCRSARRRSR